MNARSDTAMGSRFHWVPAAQPPGCICHINSIGSGPKVASAAVCWYNTIEGSLLSCWDRSWIPSMHERLHSPAQIVKVRSTHLLGMPNHPIRRTLATGLIVPRGK